MSEIMGLNIFDIVVIALVLLLSIKGLLNGFGKELFNALGLIGGIFVAAYFYKDAALYIHENFLNVSIKVLNLISVIVIFVLTWLIGNTIGKFFNSNDLSATSRIGGMIVKLISTFLIFSLIIYAFSTKKQIVQDFKSTIDGSKLYTLLRDTGAEILNMPVDLNSGNPQETTKEGTTEQNDTKAVEANTTEATTEPAKSESKKAEPAEEPKEKAQEATKTEPAKSEAATEEAAKTAPAIEANKTEEKPVKLEDIKPSKENNISKEAEETNASASNAEKNSTNSSEK